MKVWKYAYADSIEILEMDCRLPDGPSETLTPTSSRLPNCFIHYEKEDGVCIIFSDKKLDLDFICNDVEQD